MVEKNPHTLEVKYKKHTLYAITIQPDDKLQFWGDNERYNKFRNYYNEELMMLKHKYKIDYRFNIELSEPIGTVTGMGPRLHLHGWILMKSNHSIFQWLCNAMPKLLQHARLEISEIHDKEAWDNYCNKQNHIYKKSDNVLTNVADQAKLIA